MFTWRTWLIYCSYKNTTVVCKLKVKIRLGNIDEMKQMEPKWNAILVWRSTEQSVLDCAEGYSTTDRKEEWTEWHNTILQKYNRVQKAQKKQRCKVNCCQIVMPSRVYKGVVEHLVFGLVQYRRTTTLLLKNNDLCWWRAIINLYCWFC